jgi:vanillate/3-O-methylgallate O-demethylase
VLLSTVHFYLISSEEVPQVAANVPNLESKVRQSGGPLAMLRSAPLGMFQFPNLQLEYTNWRDEQVGWREAATLLDMSFHMADVYFKGPGLKRLLADVTANKITNFGKNKGKQLIAVGPDGHLIGDAILFGLEDDECSVVGLPLTSNWMRYQVEKGGYDVEIVEDPAIGFNPTGRRLTFRYQLQGPAALQIVEKASAGTMPTIKFFQIGEFSIAGIPVRALNHTMSGAPGLEKTGLEIYGPAQHSERVKEALFAAGAEFGMRQAGSLAIPASAVESGWIPFSVPAIYTSEEMRPYREWLGVDGLEANASLGGSYVTEDIEDYYVTPWDVGYGRILWSDGDFIGADALRRKAKEPHRRKVWLRWNDEDVAKAWAGGLFSDQPTKYLATPNPGYALYQYDMVLLHDRPVGVSMWAAYTRNVGSFLSLAVVDEINARDGAEVVVLWGEQNGGSNRPPVERHAQIPIRATLSTTAPV